MLLMYLEVMRQGFFCFPVTDWERVCRKLLSLVFLNFQLLARMLNFIFIRVTWKLGYLRWLNFVQENWLRGHTSCLHWKWLICFRIWCQTFPPKMWFLRFQFLQFSWLIGHSWSPKQIFKEKGWGRLYMVTIFKWRLLRKMGVWFFKGVGGAFFTLK